MSAYGILFVTHDNIDAPWVNFEAGALSKTVEKSKVSPFLFNIKRSDVKGPLLQFQSTIFQKEDIFKLISSINKGCPESERLDDARLQKVFEVWWPQLETGLNSIPVPEPQKTATTATKKTSTQSDQILEELLDLTRNQQKILRSPEELLPPKYLQYVFESLEKRPQIDPDAFEFLQRRFDLLKRLIFELKEQECDNKIIEELHDLVPSIDDVIGYLSRNVLDSTLREKERISPGLIRRRRTK